MTTYTIKQNERFNSLELTFEAIPTSEERNALKALKFRWNPSRGIWYGFAEADKVAQALAGEIVEKVTKPKAEKVNKYGIKVGDMFVASWGYEQTNLNYYQVTEIVGSEYVMVSEVYPVEICDEAVSGMSRNVKILDPRGHMLEKKKGWCCGIEDNEKGTKKKIIKLSYNGQDDYMIKIDSCIRAYIQRGDRTYYESWYY